MELKKRAQDTIYDIIWVFKCNNNECIFPLFMFPHHQKFITFWTNTKTIVWRKQSKHFLLDWEYCFRKSVEKTVHLHKT